MRLIPVPKAAAGYALKLEISNQTVCLHFGKTYHFSMKTLFTLKTPKMPDEQKKASPCQRMIYSDKELLYVGTLVGFYKVSHFFPLF